jgi:16S rRNA (guanine966-N2)-methyltransferase
MRISAGVAKGRRTVTEKQLRKQPSGEQLRPTSSKVREALFDIIRNKLEGAHFVDLYAGTGTVGLEALSRGAGHAVFVEPDSYRAEMIQKTLDTLGFTGKADVRKTDAEKFLENAAYNLRRFDILFVDPPYHSEEIGKILPIVGRLEILNEKGIVIVEHFFKKNLPQREGGLTIIKQYRYGDTMLSLYRKDEG